MRPAYQIVMNALEIGLEVKLGHYTWKLMEGIDTIGEYGSNEERRKILCVVMTNTTKNEPHYVNPGIMFNDFLYLCSRLTEEELIVIGANTALNEIKRS